MKTKAKRRAHAGRAVQASRRTSRHKAKSLGLPVNRPWTDSCYKKAFKKELRRLDVELKPLTDSLEAAVAIGESDYAIMITTKD